MPVTVIDIIKPKNAQSFPIVEDIDQLGGWRAVADSTERDAIASDRRKLGMWVYTRNDGKVWTLQGGLLNANWIEVAFGGGATLDVTTEPLTLAINPATGSDPVGVRYATQAQVTAHGAFATISGAIDTIPSDLRQGVTLELADGVHVLGKDGLGKLGRFVSEISEYSYLNWWPPDVWGFLKIKSANGLVRVAGTTLMTVDTLNPNNELADAVMSADPGFAPDTYRAFFFRVVTGTNPGKLVPIVSHTAETFVVPRMIWGIDTITAGDTVEIVEAAAKIDIQISNGGYIIHQHSPGLALILDGVDVISLSDGSDLEWREGQLWAWGGTRFLQDSGFYVVGGLFRFGQVIVKNTFFVNGAGTLVCDIFNSDPHTYTAFFSGLMFYGTFDSWIGQDFRWAFCPAQNTFLIGGTLQLFGPGTVFNSYLFTPGASTAVQTANGAQLRSPLSYAHGSAYDLYLDTTPVVLWADLVMPARGETGSTVGL